MVVYSVAMSLDGFIAAEDGGVDWLHAAMVKGESYGLSEFMNSIDGILMGSKTYDTTQKMGGFFGPSKPCWVFSKRLPASEKKDLRITGASPAEIVATLPKHGVERAWLFGGGVLAASFLEAGLIDEVSIGVMPVVLGSGLPLFGRLNAFKSLELVESKTYKGGALGLRYKPVQPTGRATKSKPRISPDGPAVAR